MKKYIGLAAIALFILLAVVAYQSLKRATHSHSPETSTQDGVGGKILWKFTTLPKGIIAQSGPYKISEQEINSKAPMKSFANKERDVLFALIYKQYVSQQKKPVKKIQFSFKKISRTPHAVLNQHGVEEKHSTKIEFSAFDSKQGLAKVDSQRVRRKDVDFNNFIWGSFATEVFRYKLAEINKQMKLKYISGEAEKLNMTTQDYQQKYIFSKLVQDISQEDINDYLKKYSIEDTERNRMTAKNRLGEQRKQRGIDYILEKYVMELPILVDLESPQFQIEDKAEWTLYWGDPKGLPVILFSDTRNSQSVELLSGIFKTFEKYKKIHFQYRPVFFEQDRMQHLTTQFHFCVLMSEPNKFWQFFRTTLGDFKDDTEQTLYKQADSLGININDLKKCVMSKKYEEVVDYHLKYAKYLGIHSGPVLYIGGEVLHGSIRLKDVENILQRQLQHPSAGVW